MCAVTIATQSYASGSSGDRGHPVELGDVGIVVGDLGAGVAQQLDQLLGRRLAHVADVGLVGDAERRGSASRRATASSPWFIACEITERQKYGMLLLTSPARSMKRVEKSNSRAFQER